MEHHQGDDPQPHQADRASDLRRSARFRLTLAAAALLAAAASAVALAAPGDAGFRGCIADSGSGGCAKLPAGSLAGASSLALSPDGRSLYVGSYGSDSVTAFHRNSVGKLTFGGCVANDGGDGCADPANDALAGVGGVAVSPGGGDVYVASGLGRSVSRFSRSGSGALTFATCTASNGAHGCVDPPKDPLVGAAGVAVGPGGSDIYVTSVDGAAVSHLRRQANGTLALGDCTADAGNFGCTATPGAVLEGAAAIVLSPKGGDAYVVSVSSSSISRFQRVKGGRLAYRGCYADDGANGCKKLPTDALLGATGVAINGNGKAVYVASKTGIVSRFARSPETGALRMTACIGRDGKGGCTEPRRDSLQQAAGIAVSPNGHDLYVAAQGSNSITHLSVGHKGKLAFVSCIASKGAHGCMRTRPAALKGSYGVALRGKSLYAAAAGGALSTFALTPASR